MVVGTVFIMVFGMATLTMVESIDESVKNSEFELSEPEVTLLSVTDKQESTGPVLTVPSWTGPLQGPDTRWPTCDLQYHLAGTGTER